MHEHLHCIRLQCFKSFLYTSSLPQKWRSYRRIYRYICARTRVCVCVPRGEFRTHNLLVSRCGRFTAESYIDRLWIRDVRDIDIPPFWFPLLYIYFFLLSRRWWLLFHSDKSFVRLVDNLSTAREFISFFIIVYCFLIKYSALIRRYWKFYCKMNK